MKRRIRVAVTAAALAAASACTEGGPGDTIPVAAREGTAEPPRSSDVLATLPDGIEKRKLFLDCTACHQLTGAHLYPPEGPRTEEGWRVVIERMREYAGAETEAPLIAPDRDPGGTAAWLVEVLAEAPVGRRAVPSPAGARITSYPYPHPEDLPHDLALDPAGGVVVTGMFSHVMMRLDPADGTWTETAIPVDFANPRAVEIDDRGDWWVLLGVPEMIARYRVEEREWDTWDIGMYGHSLRLDGSGRVAFNGHFTRQPSIVGWLDVDAGRVSTVEVAESPAPEADHPMPYGLRVGPDGLIWGTELRGGRIFAVDPEGGATRVWSMPEPAAGPRRPALDDTGSLWIPEYAANRLTRFDPRTGLFDRHALPMPDVLPYVVEVDRARGTVWVGTAAGDVVLSFDPSTRRFTTYPMPTEGALIRHLVVDESSGEVWAAYGAFPGVPPRIVRIQPSPGETGG